ncbi:unnamed protein product [Closterium sp. NIES-54]
MAARIASKSRSKIATPDLNISPQRGISVASGNWARQASVRRPKQRWVACRTPHCSPVRSPLVGRRGLTRALLLLGSPLHSSASASSTSPAAASASSTPPATATAASTSTAATEAPTSTTTSTLTPSSASPTTSSSSLTPLALAKAAPLTRSRRSAD